MRLSLWARGLSRFRTIEDAIAMGFVVLADDPPRELVLGLIGRPWRPRGDLVRLSPEEMQAFAEPGYVKVSWRFATTATGDGTMVTTTTDVWATSDDAARKFARYWMVVGYFSGGLRRSILRGVSRCATS